MSDGSDTARGGSVASPSHRGILWEDLLASIDSNGTLACHAASPQGSANGRRELADLGRRQARSDASSSATPTTLATRSMSTSQDRRTAPQR